jgi:hypothetical protein
MNWAKPGLILGKNSFFFSFKRHILRPIQPDANVCFPAINLFERDAH